MKIQQSLEILKVWQVCKWEQNRNGLSTVTNNVLLHDYTCTVLILLQVNYHVIDINLLIHITLKTCEYQT